MIFCPKHEEKRVFSCPFSRLSSSLKLLEAAVPVHGVEGCAHSHSQSHPELKLQQKSHEENSSVRFTVPRGSYKVWKSVQRDVRWNLIELGCHHWMGHITLSLMDPAKSNNRYCCCVPWAGDGGLSVHESLGSQLLPEKNVQGRKDVLVWPCVCFRCHCTHCARLMLLSDPSMAAALEKHVGKSEYLLFKNLFDPWWPKRQMQIRPFWSWEGWN